MPINQAKKWVVKIGLPIIFAFLAATTILQLNCRKKNENNISLLKPTAFTEHKTNKVEDAPEDKKTNNKMEKEIPIKSAGRRVVKKPFGIYVSPDNSPIKPERFQGYHTGVDYEIFPGEEQSEVVVRSVCSGKILSKKYVPGYGGLVIQNCQINQENVTVLYGHVSLKSVVASVGQDIDEKEILAILGNPNLSETDNERKHLHLAIHRGHAVDLRGYVKNKKDLSNWIDPCLYFCN